MRSRSLNPARQSRSFSSFSSPENKRPRQSYVLERVSDGSQVSFRMVNYVGTSRSKELRFESLNNKEKESIKHAMAKEWDKWCEFGATTFLSKANLEVLFKKH